MEPMAAQVDGLRSAAVAGNRLELVLNNSLNAIEDGRRRIMEFIAGAGQSLDETARHRLEVVFEELVANIIRHGFTENTGQSIHVRVEPKPGLVELVFEDDGTPFNPLEAERPEPFTSLEDAQIGGLGIPLIAQWSAKLHYERLTPHAGQTGFAPLNRLLVAIPI
jgi:anti-sigma regulatory factor (Ser/Thr protein kinase)